MLILFTTPFIVGGLLGSHSHTPATPSVAAAQRATPSRSIPPSKKRDSTPSQLQLPPIKKTKAPAKR
ncbi:hypothetical protein GH714_009886 [Hevea brasiliensis]|nr:hypothetical protein GH714_009886 [Hevea brasiliensis]